MEFLIPYKDERIEGAIAFFAAKHKGKLSQTALYKYLAFFDFRSLEESGEPALGLTYIAMEHGPVPKEIYIEGKYRESKYYKFEKGEENSIIIIPVSKNMGYTEYFSKYDINLMNNLIEIFKKMPANVMSKASHEKEKGIKAWTKTKLGSVINMADTFDNLEEKYYNNKATTAEEHFFICQKLYGN